MTEALAVADGYEDRYAEKLWMLLPELYRAADSDDFDVDGPLRELVNRLAVQVAVMRRSIDRLWEDQSIESSDSWLIPYLAQLVDTNLVPSMDARGQRLDVANTISYRRRKGTVAMLEQLAANVTGYDVRVVEFFRTLARTRHGLDPEIGRPADSDDPPTALALQRGEGLTGPITGTPMGGWADLRHPLGVEAVATAYDEFHHVVDLRRGAGALGWYGITKVGFFLWRTHSIGVDRATPVPVAGCDGHFTFDPTGRQIPMFQASSRVTNDWGERWLPLPSWQVPSPLTETQWQAVPHSELWPRSLSVSPLGSGSPLDPATVKVWPEVGRFATDGERDRFEVGYHYGLFSRIGAGPYDRRMQGAKRVADPTPIALVAGGSQVTLTDAIAALTNTGTLVITDGLTLSTVADVGSISEPILDVAVRAADQKRAVIRTDTADPWVFQGPATPDEPPATLRLEGLLLSGTDIVIRGRFANIDISCCTLDPGTSGDLGATPTTWARSVDGRELSPTTIWIEGDVKQLTIDRCIVGPVRTRSDGLVETLSATNSTLQALPTTVLGTIGRLFDADDLAGILKNHRDELGTWLRAQLTATTVARIDAHAEGTSLPDADAAALAVDLQSVIDGPLIWTAERFADRRLRASTLDLLASGPTGTELAALNHSLLRQAYPMALDDAAIATDAGVVCLNRCTVLGPASIHRLECSESLLDDVVDVDDLQGGCVRFSVWARESTLPRRYESMTIAQRSPVYVSRRFGEWGYAQVQDGADALILRSNTGGAPSILSGNHDNSEIGAFCRDRAALKDRSLLIKLQEFLPVGLSPVLVHLPGADPDGERTRGNPWPPRT